MPSKSRETLALTRRSDGRYCKKIAGVLHYFGRDEEQARQKLLNFYRLRDAVHPDTERELVTVQIAGEAYLARQEERVRLGELKRGTFADYEGAISDFAQHVGPTTRVVALRGDQFASFAKMLGKRLGTKAYNRNLQAVRTMFRWCFNNNIIEALPRYGDGFKSARASVRGIEVAEKIQESGERRFTHEELKAIFAHPRCVAEMRTFVLLGLNAGLYSKDISDLIWDEVGYEGGEMVIDRKREKNSERQKFVCWPEVRRDIECRPRFKGRRVFLTCRGNPWNTDNKDSLGQAFDKILDSVGKRSGLGFGAMRHTHVSAVAELSDRNAAHRARGHLIQGIERHYDFPSVTRLAAIASHARQALLLKVVPPSTAWVMRTPWPTPDDPALVAPRSPQPSRSSKR